MTLLASDLYDIHHKRSRETGEYQATFASVEIGGQEREVEIEYHYDRDEEPGTGREFWRPELDRVTLGGEEIEVVGLTPQRLDEIDEALKI